MLKMFSMDRVKFLMRQKSKAERRELGSGLDIGQMLLGMQDEKVG